MELLVRFQHQVKIRRVNNLLPQVQILLKGGYRMPIHLLNRWADIIIGCAIIRGRPDDCIQAGE